MSTSPTLFDNDELLAAMEKAAGEDTGTGDDNAHVTSMPPAPATPVLVTLPPLDTELPALARWWREQSKLLYDHLRAVKDHLTAHLAQGGELAGLGVTWSYEYAPDAAAEFPGLVTRRAVTATVQSEEEFQQIVEFLIEFVPEAENKFDLQIDNRAANSIILHRGAGGERLAQLRAETPRLVIK